MTRDELLDALRQSELDLRSAEMIQFVKQQALNIRTDFAADLATLSAAIETIENADLAAIAMRLEASSAGLKAGIQALSDSIDSVDKTIAIFAEIGSVVGLAARVAGLAA